MLNVEQPTRKLERRETFAWPDIQRLIQDNDLSDYNTFLVLNGGTGVGKTSSVMRQVQQELEHKFNRAQTLLVVESRTATVDQLNTNYTDKIECINGVDVCQRLGFMHRINNNNIKYDWVVIDECHGLFSEASFAEDAAAIASWIKGGREKTHIIFVTANDEYFDDLSKRFFPNDYNFIYLFPDFTHYVSHTYVKEIQFIKTNRVDEVIETLARKLVGQKGIIFLKKASDVKDWFFKLLNTNQRVGMIVSQANETNAALTTTQELQIKNAAINLSGGQAGLTMADLCELFDVMRKQQGKEGIREAIINERLPEDIDILLATDTIQEGISIKSTINYIIIEGFTEVEVRQKLGRFRGNLDLLFILFNPNAARRQTFDKLQIFDTLIQLYNDGNQVALAEFYGRQKGIKSSILFLVKEYDPESQQFLYKPNYPAYFSYQRDFKLYNKLVSCTKQTIESTYSYPLLLGAPKILDYDQDIKGYNVHQQIEFIVNKWRNVPLKGAAQEKLLQDFKELNIVDQQRRPVTTFRKCCSLLTSYGYNISSKRATKQDLVVWPQYLTNLKEEYKYII